MQPKSIEAVDLKASKNKVESLVAPRNVVLVGASDRPGSWAARVWRNLNRYQFSVPPPSGAMRACSRPRGANPAAPFPEGKDGTLGPCYSAL